MPGDIISLIVGGGIQPLAPWTLNYVPFVSTVQPPTLTTTDFVAMVPVGANRGLIISTGADPQPAATERLRVKGGAIIEGVGTNSVAIGLGASTALSDGVAIGRAAIVTGQPGVAVGQGAATTQGVSIGHEAGFQFALTGGVSIGFRATASAAPSIAIGPLAFTGFFSGNTAHIAIGQNCRADNTQAGGRAIAMGIDCLNASWNGVAIGADSSIPTTGHAGAIVIGTNAKSLGANCLVIGGDQFNDHSITTVLIGGGNTRSAPQAVLYRITNATGVDIAGANLRHQAGLGTGAGVPGRYEVLVGAVLASGGTAQTGGVRASVGHLSILLGNQSLATFVGGGLVTGVEESLRVIRAAGPGDFVAGRVNGTLAAPTAVLNGEGLGSLTFGGWDGTAQGRGALLVGHASENWAVGAHGSAYSFWTVPNTTAVAVRRWTMQQDGHFVPFAADSYDVGATALPIRALYYGQDRGILATNQTDGAGAGAGTLGNAPAAGDPTFWLKLTVNGATVCVPCWPG